MFLLLENYGVRNLEAVFAVLISTMGLSFAWMFADAQPSGKELLIGYISNNIFNIPTIIIKSLIFIPHQSQVFWFQNSAQEQLDKQLE